MTQILQADIFKDFSSIQHGFFTRQGGVSEREHASLNCSYSSLDNPANVKENIRRVAERMGVVPENLVMCRQIHSSTAVFVNRPWGGSQPPEADAMVTVHHGLALAILTADCLPVLFVEPELGVIGAAHAGWRGALGGVLEKTILTMENQGARRDKIHAALGPCIWQDSYEVDASFPIPFLQEDEANIAFFTDSKRRGHFMFDLPGFVQAKLEGLQLASVSPSPADTCADEDRFFSHRRGMLRGKKEDGRMLSCIALVK